MTDTVTAPFEDAEQQRHAAKLGIWSFLATEILFFGAAFAVYALYRFLHPEAFLAAARTTRMLVGTINTAILLASGIASVLTVKFERLQMVKYLRPLVIATIALGAAFVAVKGYEYTLDIRDGYLPGTDFKMRQPAAQIFWSLYWLMTGVHLLHLSIGLGLYAHLLRLLRQFPAGSIILVNRIEVTALYWAFVDIVWIMIYPLLYLAGRS